MKRRTITILFIIVFIFWVKQACSMEVAEYKAEGLRDPFREEKIETKVKEEPQEEIEVVSLPNIAIQGIVWGGVFPQAIINNKVVKIGDTIGETKIIDIGKSGIIVLQENKKYKLAAPSVAQIESLGKKKEGGKNEEALF